MIRRRAIRALGLAVVSALAAQSQENRPDGILGAVYAINDALRRSNAEAFAALFLTDGDLWIGGEIAGKGRQAIQAAFREPPIWSEKTAPQFRDASVRRLSDDLALVDATQVQYGSVIVRQSAPVMILFRRVKGEWRVLTMRIGAWRL